MVVYVLALQFYQENVMLNIVTILQFLFFTYLIMQQDFGLSWASLIASPSDQSDQSDPSAQPVHSAHSAQQAQSALSDSSDPSDHIVFADLSDPSESSENP